MIWLVWSLGYDLRMDTDFRALESRRQFDADRQGGSYNYYLGVVELRIARFGVLWRLCLFW